MSGVRIHLLDARLWADERGWGVRPLEAASLAGVPLGDLHVVSLRPGKVRGDHHHDGTEWLLITEGIVEVRSRASEDEPVRTQTLEGEHPILLEIPPGVRHAIRNAGERTIYLVAFSDRERLATTKAPLV